jgi:uncharacterized protein (TIGR03083 family)
MSSWNAMTYEGKPTVLKVVRREAGQFFEMVDNDDVWHAQTGAGHWQVRDVVAHIVDTTEAYFVAFDAARSGTELQGAYGLPGMAERVDKMASVLRDEPRPDLVGRLRNDFDRMMQTFEGLGEDDWTTLMVSHFYMGPVPAFFYPAFQLMDYGVHSWDVRQGSGRAHALSGEVADLLVPFMFGIWQGTANVPPSAVPSDLGVRITTGPNAGDTVMHVTPDGLSYESGDVSGVSTVIEFDPSSFVLTAFGRFNGGTVRGDAGVAADFLNLFFRI